MKATLRYFLVLLFLLPILFLPHTATVAQAQTQAQATRPWQQVTVPSTSEVAANFKSPPHEYGAISAFTGWGGPDPEALKKRITTDLDRMSANGMFLFNLSSGRKSPGEPAYLSPGHMDEVKFIVQEAAKRNMRFWIQDESNYPSGFAGGYISERYPQLGMQDITADITVHVAPGQTLQMPVPPDTLAIWSTETDQTGAIKQVIPIPVPADLQLKYLTPAEGTTPNEPRYTWQVQFLRHVYLSSPTRNDNRADGTRAKDGTYSLIDYLDPKATDAFLHITHETYYGAVGDQFGKIVLGFFGDEPDYSSGIPWTPKLLEEFKAQKGYDLAPYLPSWFDRAPIKGSDLARADYYDVWSNIFKDSFFGEQANWAKAHNVEYLVHLNHEETMLSLERSEGDYFRDNRYVEVPGIDNLSQLVPSAVHGPDGSWTVNNNFPKLASSAAHLFGKPKVWAESGGGPGVDGKYEMNFQLVRGVNALQVRANGLRAGGGPGGGQASGPPPPDTPLTLWYANRASYLIAIGRPAAQVGLYHPGNTIWMSGADAQEADHSTTKLGWQLFEHQVDWDYFDEQSLSSVATLENGGFKNLSGQTYKAIVFPSMTVITRTGLTRLQAFAKQGGKVIFVGKTPSLILDKTFMDAKEKPDLSFATLVESSGDITPAVIAALPKPDVKLDSQFLRLTYTHRQFTDGDMYFFFNESTKAESRMATIAGHGTAQDWDMATGEIHPMLGTTSAGDSVTVPLVLGPYEAKVIVVGPLPKVAAAAEPAFVSGEAFADLSGDWKLDMNGKQLTTPIKPWEQLGSTSFAGPATYSMQFTAATAPPKGKHVYLEIADVHDYAHVTLNGKEVGARSFQPYRWDVTGALIKGANDLKIEVYASVAQVRPAAPPPAAGAAPALATLPAGAGTASGAGAVGTGGGRGGRGGRGGAAGAPAAGAPPAGAGGGGRGAPSPATSGLLGSVKLVAY